MDWAKNTRPYWLRYEEDEVNCHIFWKMWLLSLCRPALIDDEEFGDVAFPDEKGISSRIYHLKLQFSRLSSVEDPARDKPIYYFIDYVYIPEYPDRETPYEYGYESYKLYSIRYFDEKYGYLDNNEYARDHKEMLGKERNYGNKKDTYTVYIFPLFYDEVISYEYLYTVETEKYKYVNTIYRTTSYTEEK